MDRERKRMERSRDKKMDLKVRRKGRYEYLVGCEESRRTKERAGKRCV